MTWPREAQVVGSRTERKQLQQTLKYDFKQFDKERSENIVTGTI